MVFPYRYQTKQVNQLLCTIHIKKPAASSKQRVLFIHQFFYNNAFLISLAAYRRALCTAGIVASGFNSP